MSSSDPKPGPKPGSWPPAPESSPMPPSTWAKKTGFRPKFSGETTATTDSGHVSLSASAKSRQQDNQPDLEAGQTKLRPPPVSSSTVANGETEKDNKKEKPPPPPPLPPPPTRTTQVPVKDQPVKRRRDSDGVTGGRSLNGPDVVANGSNGGDPIRRPNRIEETVEVLPQSIDDDFVARNLHMKYGLRDTPGLGENDLFNF